MAMSNCARCGKVFLPDAYKILCSECLVKERKDLKIVSEYLRKHPMVGIMEVATHTGVDSMQILRFVRSGSLHILDAPDSLKCRFCGKKLKKGTLCQECMEIVSNLKDTTKKQKDNTANQKKPPK